MKFTWSSAKSPFIAAYIFEGLFGPIRCSIRYMLHQIQQNRHDETESKIASSESYDVLFSIGSIVCIYQIEN